jgi:hypothetical protein
MDPKVDSEELVSALLPFAERMLRQFGEFYPYGGYLKPDGTVVEVGAKSSDTDQPKSKDLIDVLRSSFREMASAGKCRAVAVIFDVVVTLPKSTLKSNAIQVCLDHADGYSSEVFFPYRLANNELQHCEVFAQEGEHAIFGSS